MQSDNSYLHERVKLQSSANFVHLIVTQTCINELYTLLYAAAGTDKVEKVTAVIK